jgi:hypothetical protein
LDVFLGEKAAPKRSQKQDTLFSLICDGRTNAFLSISSAIWRLCKAQPEGNPLKYAGVYGGHFVHRLEFRISGIGQFRS